MDAEKRDLIVFNNPSESCALPKSYDIYLNDDVEVLEAEASSIDDGDGFLLILRLSNGQIIRMWKTGSIKKGRALAKAFL